MKLLALDTSSGQCSAALLLDGTLIHREVLTPREHAQLLLPMIEALRAEAGVSLQALDGIAFGRGPGSFTGVRIAAAVTQGLAAGADLPVLPVSSLRALAAQAMRRAEHGDGAEEVRGHETLHAPARTSHAARSGRVLACMDARMGEVYWGLFDASLGDVTEHVSPPPVLIDAASRVSAVPPVSTAAGRGLAAYPTIAVSLQVAAQRVFGDAEPHALEVARLAAADLAGGARWLDAAQAQPVYLRNQVTQAPKATVPAPL